MQLDEDTGICFDQGVQTVFSFMDAQSHCSFSMLAVLDSENRGGGGGGEEEEEQSRLLIKIILNERCRLLRESEDGFIVKMEDERTPGSYKWFCDVVGLYAQLDCSKKRVRRMMSHFELHRVAKEFLTERLASSATYLADLAMKKKCATLVMTVKMEVVTSLLVQDEGESPLKAVVLSRAGGRAAGLDEEKQSKSRCNGAAASCVVCFEEIGGPAVAASLPCSHSFHTECIMHWLAERQTCPVCRLEIPLLHTNLQAIRRFFL